MHWTFKRVHEIPVGCTLCKMSSSEGVQQALCGQPCTQQACLPGSFAMHMRRIPPPLVHASQLAQGHGNQHYHRSNYAVNESNKISKPQEWKKRIYTVIKKKYYLTRTNWTELFCFKNIPSGLLIPIMPISRTYFLQSDVSLLEICLWIIRGTVGVK